MEQRNGGVAMKYLIAMAMLVAMAVPALGQDPNGNRLNEPFPVAQQKGGVSADSGSPSMYANRMNVSYSESSSRELTGGPNPYRNRMNLEWPREQPKPEPKKIEQEPIYPTPRL
jgi:hypothetical protein